MDNYKLIGPFSQLLTLSNMPLKGALSDNDLEIITQAGILVENGQIRSIGKFSSLLKMANSLNARILEIEGEVVGVPGFVDMHTHLCFAGSRAKDYAMRNTGKSYLEIAESGGGIWDSVQQTRKTSQRKLTEGIIQRVHRHLSNGITTIEVKSGYGLSIKEELKMLRAIKEANQQVEADLIATCLAAHLFPKDYAGNPVEYLYEISSQLFPRLKLEKLTNRIDAFVEKGAFSIEQIRPYFQNAKEMGFDLTVHADQFHAGGSALAVEMKASSADHLEASTEKEIQLLAKSNVVAVALPGATLGLGCNFTPARKLLDAGASLAVASDWNPGSAPMGDLLTQAAILGTFQKLSTAELFAGMTYRAAEALKLKDRGRLQSDYLADIVAFPTHDYREIFYQQGQMKPLMVWKKGSLVHGFMV